ncbi:competence type IV pilus ATPase ComGA [Vagococcus elongatus]|uniref:Bacterial type II secretion system protein E domain-containing protein n=1 Tax=Vagococcus elongatus TaxID=180344 RepID=A0A430B167_9ENTE|nr:competence type IV pilus ATPase ComGA [Vagococcus elongatus]RSU14039.1 hypothetical protein CBF29_03910 [Vagococcus elongatus]
MKDYVNRLCEKAFRLKASDLYIFPAGDRYELAFRIHQQKKNHEYVTEVFAEKLILYLKYSANMDVGEKRRIQIGSTSFVTKDGRKRRMRLSAVANYRYQETLVIRFLHDIVESSEFHLFFPKEYEKLKKSITGNGLFLFAGATGSGKSTTMYSLAREIACSQKQVITVEDPVEIECPEFLQLQTNDKIGLTYDDLVQVCLRHRPDLLIVGEIRDRQTAQAVVRGALTGHQIFSTIHGMDKHSVLFRLLELGVNQEDVRQCLKGVIYQTILPIACPYCEEKCSVYCPNQKSAVLFDIFYYEGSQLLVKTQKKKEDFQKKLRKAWALGYISSQTFEQFCI